MKITTLESLPPWEQQLERVVDPCVMLTDLRTDEEAEEQASIEIVVKRN